MGTISGHKRINQSLSFKHEQFRIESLDTLIAKGFELVKNTELFRCKFTPLWNELIKQSGAIVLEAPHFESAMNGLLMKIACDLNGNLYKNISINQSHPFISIDKGETDISTDLFLIIQAFQSVCAYSIENASQIKEMESSYMEYTQQSRSFQKDHEKYFSSQGVPPCDIISYSKRLKKYLKTFKFGYDICLQMKKYVNEVDICLKEYEDYCNSEEIMGKFEKIGKEAYKKSITKPTKIMFKYSPEKKIGNYEDYYDRVLDDAKIDRNCRQVLSFYSLSLKDEGRLNKTISESSQKKSIVEENNNKMSEECKEECKEGSNEECRGESNDGNEIRECKESKNNIVEIEEMCEYCTFKTEADKEIETSNKEKEVKVPRPNMMISHEQQIQIDDDDDIIDNIDSDNEYGSSIKEATTKEGASIFSINNLHLKETINIYPKANAYPSAFVYLKNRSLLVTGLSNGAIVITNTTNSTEQKTILCHKKKVTSLIYLNDDKSIISGSKDGHIYKHNLNSNSCTLIGSEDSIDAMVNLFNDNSILVASNTTVIAYDYNTNKKLYSFTAHDDKIKGMEYNIAKDMLVTCSRDKKIKLWNSSNQECIGVLKGVTNTITSLCYAKRKDQFVVVSASKNGFVTFWNLSDKNLTKSIKMKIKVRKLIYLDNGKNVLGINDDYTFTIFDLETNEYKNFNSNSDTITNDSKYTNGVYFNDGNTIALGTRSAFVQLWDCY